MIRSMINLGLLGALALLFAAPLYAQSIQLTPEQRAMLDQLPPAQRQQAMEAIRQFERQNAGESAPSNVSEELELPETSFEQPEQDWPLIREDLPELAEYAVKKGMRAVISTNGTLITREMAQILKDIGLSYVGISPDGMEQVNDRFRGV